MNLQRIIKSVRSGLFDDIGADAQRLWKDDEIVEYINDAIREICIELSCLTSDDDFSETSSTGTITLAGTAGQVDSVSVNGAVITSGAVLFNGTLAQTSIDLAANITAYASNPANTNPILFIAGASGSVVTISGPVGTGSTPNGYPVSASVSGGMSYISTQMSSGACMCKLFLVSGQSRYYLHPKVIQITRFKPSLSNRPLSPIDKNELDASNPNWEASDPGTPYAFIPNYSGTQKKVTIVLTPKDSDTVKLDVVRFPYVDLDISSPDAEPEISSEYHALIMPWAKRQAYLKNDVETNDKTRSEKYEREFYRLVEQAKVKLDIHRRPAIRGVSHPGMY